MPRPLVISHRTQMGTHPENSLAGIAAALNEGVDGIELDVRATADGVPMLLHDDTLRRTHNDARRLAQLTAAEAHALDVPSLAEAVRAVDRRCTLYIEVKERGLGATVRDAVREAGATAWCWVWAFDPVVAAESRDALPGVPMALNTSRDAAAQYGYASAIEVATTLGLRAVSLDRRLVTPELVAGAHERGLVVFTWTVDEPADIEAVLAAGVDGVCSNFPSRVREALARPR